MKGEGLDNMDCTEGQADWRAGIEEKSKLEAERSSSAAEKWKLLGRVQDWKVEKEHQQRRF